MISLMEAVLLLGAAFGPDELSSAPEWTLQDEAMADLGRRLAAGEGAEERKERRQQEDPKPQRPEQPVQAPVADEGRPWIDFEWLELHARVGIAMFGKDYHIDPSPIIQIEARAPVTLIAPSDNPDGDYFGVFAQLDAAPIKRTIEPSVDKPSGVMLALTIGADFTILRNSTWMILVRGGIQYATYGGVTDLNDGMAPVVGLTAGVAVARGVAITVSPSYIMVEKGNSIIIGTVGVEIDF